MTRPHLSALVTQAPSVWAGRAALRRLHRLTIQTAEPAYVGDEPLALVETIELVGIGHGFGDRLLFDDVSLRLAAGRVVALAGPNGAGKTTLVRLVLGLERPCSGKLRADGIDYDRIDMKTLRARIGLVTQDPALFAATIRHNLSFGLDPAPSDDRLDEALQLAGAAFVGELEDGLDTAVGDRGVRLSGGQRQRLSIARALLRRPALLILDEPTNHLGSAATSDIMRRVRARHPDIAMLIVSHDPEMLALADEVRQLTPALPAAA